MKSLAALVTVLLVAAHAEAASSTDDRLDAAEAHAVQGDADSAVKAYEALLDDGVDFAELRYNLGTLHLARGELGRAVLHLRTALKRDPAHEDAAHNLEVALAAREDRVIGTDLEPALGDRVASWLPGDAAAWALLGLWLALSLVVGAVPWLPTRGRGAASAIAVVLVVGSLAAGAVVVARATVLARTEAVVLDDEVEAKVAPDPSAAASFTAHVGLYGVVLEEEAGFCRVRLDNGLDAWIPKAALGFVGE